MTKIPATCRHCGKTLSSNYSLNRHILQYHTENPAFQCPHCPKSYRNKEIFDEHVRGIHSLDDRYKCQVCNKRFQKKAYLSDHMSVHTKEKPFVCFCGKKFKTNQNLRRHNQWEHIQDPNKSQKPKPVTECKECGRNYPTNSQLKLHLKNHHLPEQSQEQEQTQNGQWIDQVAEEKPKSKVNEKEEVQCEQCGIWCFSQSYLKDHIQVTHEEKSFMCSQCAEMFSSKKKLANHLRSVHKIEEKSTVIDTNVLKSLDKAEKKQLKRWSGTKRSKERQKYKPKPKRFTDPTNHPDLADVIVKPETLKEEPIFDDIIAPDHCPEEKERIFESNASWGIQPDDAIGIKLNVQSKLKGPGPLSKKFPGLSISLMKQGPQEEGSDNELEMRSLTLTTNSISVTDCTSCQIRLEKKLCKIQRTFLELNDTCKCESFNDIFGSSGLLKCHVERIPLVKSFYCLKCVKNFMFKKDLLFHLNSEHHDDQNAVISNKL